MNTSECRDLFAFNDWANGRMLESLGSLTEDQWLADVGGSFGSIRDTTAHLIAAEWLWLRRWMGSSPTEAPEWLSGSSLERLRTELNEVESRRRAWLDGLAESTLAEKLTYSFLSGAQHRTELSLLLRHLVNHSTYHRGQIATLLRQLGQVPPSTDLVVWDHQRLGG